jgi:hypothetical protein
MSKDYGSRERETGSQAVFITSAQAAIVNGGGFPNSASILDEVTQVLQLDGEVHIVHHDLFGHLQDDGREI